MQIHAGKARMDATPPVDAGDPHPRIPPPGAAERLSARLAEPDRLMRTLARLSDAGMRSVLLNDLHDHASELPARLRLPSALRHRPAGYYAQRRVLGAWRVLAPIATDVQSCWQGYASRRQAEREAVIEAIGLRIIAAGLRLCSGDRAARWLAPLGSRTARQIIDEASRRRAEVVSAVLTEACHEAFQQERHRCGMRIPPRLGAGLLNELSARIGSELSRALRRLCPELAEARLTTALAACEGDRPQAQAWVHEALAAHATSATCADAPSLAYPGGG